MRQNLGILVISFVAVACSSPSPDDGPPTADTAIDLPSNPGYGPPTADTAIHLEERGGLWAPSRSEFARIVDVAGTSVTYIAPQRMAQTTIDQSDVATIIDALESARFLDLDSEALANCVPTAVDAPIRTIHVAVSAGANDVLHDMNCMGGAFDDLLQLEQQIFDASGFTAWEAAN